MKETKISREDVEYVAALARLNLSEEDIETFTRQLDGILTYMGKLNELDTSEVEPTTHVIDISNAFREDVVEHSFPQEVILENAPDREGGFFKVPKIIGE